MVVAYLSCKHAERLTFLDVRGSFGGRVANVGVLVTRVSSHVQWVWVHTIRESFFPNC